MKKSFLPLLSVIVLFLLVSSFTATDKLPPQEYYQLTIYHLKTAEQLATTNAYLKNSYLPELHKTGLKNIGVFNSIDNDTAIDKKIVVLIPFASMQQFEGFKNNLSIIKLANTGEAAYTTAAFNNAPFERMETVLLKGFKKMPQLKKPALTAPATDRIYELRSYESATEKIYSKKVSMFNEGGEVDLFNQLNFNAVFYGEVLVGSHMPNLMYMTTFNNKADHDAHWKSFVSDTTWKRLSTMPEYLNTVSKADIYLLRPADYSDF